MTELQENARLLNATTTTKVICFRLKKGWYQLCVTQTPLQPTYVTDTNLKTLHGVFFILTSLHVGKS